MHPDLGGAGQQNGAVGAEETTPIQAALQERRFRSTPPIPRRGASAIDFLFLRPNQDPLPDNLITKQPEIQ